MLQTRRFHNCPNPGTRRIRRLRIPSQDIHIVKEPVTRPEERTAEAPEPNPEGPAPVTHVSGRAEDRSYQTVRSRRKRFFQQRRAG
jgi:hypothetical protein